MIRRHVIITMLAGAALALPRAVLAQQRGLTVPPTLLASADEAIA
jgi:hypothetical protein